MELDEVIDFTGGVAPVETVDPDERYAVAVARLRLALLASEPGLPPGLVTGESVEEVEASFDAARLAAPARVPAGAPPRTLRMAATPREKIRDGLARLA